MSATTHALAFEGNLLRRGFWLYVWEIQKPDGSCVHYVGRTGDSSSPHAQSAFNRVSQHLGFNAKHNALRRHLVNHGVEPAACSFRFVAHGPLLSEVANLEAHRGPRDGIAALEKALAEAMEAAGYPVLNTVHCRKPVGEASFAQVRAAFAVHFPSLATSPAAQHARSVQRVEEQPA